MNTVFKGAKWSDKTSTWTVKTDNASFEGRFLINCMGFLYKPNVPKFKGIENFKGRWFHSARWEQDYDWRGKKIGVIGAGATAIQVVPEMAKTAQVTMFQRTACSGTSLQNYYGSKETILRNDNQNFLVLVPYTQRKSSPKLVMYQLVPFGDFCGVGALDFIKLRKSLPSFTWNLSATLSV